MNEIIFSNYKFTLELNDTTLNIQIYNIINNNLFEGSIYEKTINKFYKMILNALNKTENFNITINEEEEIINVIINYDNYFEKFFKLNKINDCVQDKNDELKINIALLTSHNKILEQEIKNNNDNIDIIISHNKQLEQKIKDNNNEIKMLISPNCINLAINIGYNKKLQHLKIYKEKTHSCYFIKSIIFYKNDKIFDYSEYTKNIYNYMLQTIFNKITINIINEEYDRWNSSNQDITYDELYNNNRIKNFLQSYSKFINQIIINGYDYKNKMEKDIIGTLGDLTNYKELHINDDQLEDHCKRNNIKFIKIEN